MANTFAPFGFSVTGRLDGAAWSGNHSRYLIKYDNTNTIFSGDPVVMLNTGYIDEATPGTTPLLGIFAGCSFISAAEGKRVFRPYFPGSDTITDGEVEAFVIDDPNVVMLVQTGWSAGTPAAATQTMVGVNGQFAMGTGSTRTGQSGAYLDLNTTPTTTSTLPFRILELIDDPPGANGSDTATAYNYVKVCWNNHFFKQLTGI